MRKPHHAALVLLTVCALTAAERDYLVSVVSAVAGEKPLCEQTAVAALILAESERRRADLVETVAELTSDGTLSDTAVTAPADKSGDRYRITRDAVDAALSGAVGERQK